jgi:tetratricopeptide (TPR) repeat protein
MLHWRIAAPGSHRLVRNLLAVLCMSFFVLLADSQQSGSASLGGTIRDAQAKAVANAVVELQSKDSTHTRTVHTDSQGGYTFPALREGVYSLRVTMKGYADAEIPSLFLVAKEVKTVDLTLGPSKTSPDNSAAKPHFFDEPQFTVAGVTDTTALGGHGSDTIVRTRETLAKDTVLLSKPRSNASPNSSSEKSLRENLERQPAGFDANYRLGQWLIENGKAREAIPYLERAAETNPADYDNAYDLARAYADAGNFDRARDQIRGLLPAHDKADLHHLLGDVEEKLSDPLEAVRQYERAAEMDPIEPYVFDWGSELLLHHAPEPALDVFTMGNRLFPHSSRMLLGLGAAWFARGSYDEAVRRICQASDLNPSDPAPYLFLGKMQRTESKPSDEVAEKLHRFVTLHPQSAEANYYYAVTLWKIRKGQLDTVDGAEVESLLNRALHLDPKFAAADLQLGILLADEGNYSAAVADYQRAVQIDPQMEEAHYRMAQAYRQLADGEKAKEELRLYEQLAKESAQKVDRERHEIRQFVYTLRDQPSPHVP